MTDSDYAIPRATYRLQLNKTFTFQDAAAIGPYLATLGISHVYLSPILKARPGSMHGYDTVDQTMLNPELGSLDDFRAMAGEFRRHGLGIVVDIVPNHMGIGGDQNLLWLDVLEWGEASRHADWFDIDWTPPEPTLKGKVLVPFLGSSFTEALGKGRIELRFDAVTGTFAAWAEDTHKLPLDPKSYAIVLSACGEHLAPLAQAFDAIAAGDVAAADAAKGQLAELSAQGGVAARIEGRLDHLNGSGGRGDFLALIEKQHWRLARYSVAADDINYRRFFIVSDLAAIRIEHPDVFEHAHRLIFDLVAEGLIDGLRVDHVDGLYDPKAYARKLREACPRPIYLVVEKILAPHELLRADWGVDGTTGYEFSAHATRLLVDPESEAALTQFYRDFTGSDEPLATIERETKLGIIDYEMAAELDALTTRLRAIAMQRPGSVDLTRNALRHGLRQIIASMPVYRSYVDDDVISGIDRRNIAVAVARARLGAPTLDPAIFDFLTDILTASQGADDVVLDCARRVQQYSGPVMAKGLEDTALYRFNRLIALSDVGEKPDRFSETVAAFHDFNRTRRQQTPNGMLTTSTHDTKRGEDTRNRIVAITGKAPDWIEALQTWTQMLAPVAGCVERNDLYYFFQLLLGAWPVELSGQELTGNALLGEFRERLDGAMLKSIRETRQRTNWIVPNAAYEEQVSRLVKTALDAEKSAGFLRSFEAFENSIGFAGARNGLILAALKLTMPGVPDFYQGAELWEQSMVDPDNRRPVDFQHRLQLLAEIDADENIVERLQNWRDGSVKLALIQRLLALRRSKPLLFSEGTYEPVPAPPHILAVLRRHGRDFILLVTDLAHGSRDLPPTVSLPFSAGTCHELLRSRTVESASEMQIGEMLADDLPLTVLEGTQL